MPFKFFQYFLSILILQCLGCANWSLRETCEMTNWFEYSQNVAFQGKYLEEDGLVKACKGIESVSAVQLDQGFKLGREKMCQYDEIHSRAKEGIPVFFKFCDGLEMNRMKELYRQGLEIYCTSEKAYSFGKSGKLYQNLCNASQEKVFLPAYHKGRKEYLTSYKQELQNRLLDLKALETSFARTESNIQREYATLPQNALLCSLKSVYDSSSKKNELRQICEEAPYIQVRRSTLWRELDKVRNELKSIREEWRETEQKISQAQMEFNAIP